MGNQALSLIDEEIRRLQELRRMAEDPHMLELMRKLSNVNGHSPQPAIIRPMAPVAPPAARQPASKVKGIGLTEGITQAVEQLPGIFTIHDVFATLGRNGVKIGAAKPMIAISGVLQRLVERKVIECVEKGRAGLPSKYRRIDSGTHPELPMA